MRRFVLSCVTTLIWSAMALTALAQPSTALWPSTPAAVRPSRPDTTIKRQGRVVPNLTALLSPRVEITLLDGQTITFTRVKSETPKANTRIWTGDAETGAQAVFVVVDGVLSGTVFVDGNVFEVIATGAGSYALVELDSTAFPTDDGHTPDLVAPDVLGSSTTTTPTTAADGGVVIDVMIVWTPAAELQAGGVSAIQSRIVNAIANANLVYANSGVPAQLRLVHSAPVTFTETVINTDLNNLRGTTDGMLDDIHALRTSVGADIVSLFGAGYRTAGYCGMGSIMTTISTSFAPMAFNIVDQSCAVSNLSFTHEVGHNQGLHHDPANATSAGATAYAYGYQDPLGTFRTVMSYGTATRIPYLSSPVVYYNGGATGTTTQDNARTLAATAPVVASLRTDPTAPAPTPACTYSLSATSLSFTATGGSRSINITTPTGCAWSFSAVPAWLSVGPSSGSGSGAFVVTVAPTTVTRSATLTVAGLGLRVAQSTKRR